MVVSLKTDLRFPIPGQQGHGGRIIHYERITYLVSSLGYSQYLQFLIGKYMDLAQADEEREEREHEIYLEYPEYYEDEGILEEEKWLEEFLNQLPEKKREYFEKLIKES